MPADPIPDPLVRIVACGLVGWFDDLDAMNQAGDPSRGLQRTGPRQHR
jgi:hypothetical protein